MMTRMPFALRAGTALAAVAIATSAAAQSTQPPPDVSQTPATTAQEPSDQGEIVITGFDRPNLRLAFQPKDSPRKQVMSFVAARRGQSGIVYCQSRKTVEQMAEFLQQQGIRALPYHAGMRPYGLVAFQWSCHTVAAPGAAQDQPPPHRRPVPQRLR